MHRLLKTAPHHLNMKTPLCRANHSRSYTHKNVEVIKYAVIKQYTWAHLFDIFKRIVLYVCCCFFFHFIVILYKVCITNFSLFLSNPLTLFLFWCIKPTQKLQKQRDKKRIEKRLLFEFFVLNWNIVDNSSMKFNALNVILLE